MTATIIPLRRPTEAEAHVIRLAERSEFLEREKMMHALFQSVVLLKEIAELERERK